MEQPYDAYAMQQLSMYKYSSAPKASSDINVKPQVVKTSCIQEEMNASNSYLCCLIFSATGSSVTSVTASTAFPFFSVAFSTGFLGGFSAGGCITGA